MTLFDLSDYLPPGEVKRRATKRPGQEAWNKKFSEGSKVVRVPATWNRDELLDRIEVLQSALGSVEDELAEARSRTGSGQLSNRFEKLAQFVAELREAWPAGDVYDPFRDL